MPICDNCDRIITEREKIFGYCIHCLNVKGENSLSDPEFRRELSKDW